MTAFQFACLSCLLASMCVIGACVTLLLRQLVQAVNAIMGMAAMSLTADQLPTVVPREDRR